MTDLIFSFDTEDLVNIDGIDGVLRTAQILRKHNIRGCFQMVGKFAELLEKTGRTDVIEELKHHEIDDHSRAHSVHPTINEITDIEDYNEAYSKLLPLETECLNTLKRVFGINEVYSACPPGNSVSYVAHYLYSDMKIPVYCGDVLVDGRFPCPINYCNMLCTDYDLCLEFFLMERDENDEPVRLRSHDEIKKHFEWVAANKDLYVCYHHPSMSMYSQWWDQLNFNGENTPEEQWKLSKRNSDDYIEGYYERFDFLVDMLKKDCRFNIITYEELSKKYTLERRNISLSDVPTLKAMLDEAWHPVTAPASYCMADIFHACRAFLCGESEYICSKVKCFLKTPYAITFPITVTKNEMILSAKELRADGWLPEAIKVGKNLLGPADWLRAALCVLCGEDIVTVKPEQWQIDMDQFAKLRDLDLKLKWIDTKHLMDNYLSQRSRLQSWTIRLPEGYPRKIAL